ncbi:hypothetical protein [Nocardia nova]|uniref:hypothetical protein n=1 Tax=Nocardia nova TaxID=37330 RepID=UPI0033F49A22
MADNMELCAARRALTSPVTGHALSRDEVAEAVNAWAAARNIPIAMTGNYVGRLERGAFRWPNAHYREALRAVLGCASDAELGFRPPRRGRTEPHPGAPIIDGTHHVAPTDTTDEDDDMHRRHMLAGGTTIGLALIMGGAATSPARIGSGEARRLAERVDEYCTDEQQLGGGALARNATADLADAKRVLRMCAIDSAAESAFTSAAGNMAVMAGWLHFDADDPAKARDCYRDAMAMAAEAGDDELAVHVCLNQAYQTTAEAQRGHAHPTSALRLTHRAAELTRRQPSGRVHALIDARTAMAHAALGDRSAFEKSITSAWREMELAHDREPLDQCPTWLRFMCHTEVRYHEACGLAYLGAASRSLELFGQVAASHAGQRNSAYYHAWLATAMAQTGNIDDAVAEAEHVVADLDAGVSSQRTLRVLEPVHRAASATRHEQFTIHYNRLAKQV